MLYCWEGGCWCIIGPVKGKAANTSSVTHGLRLDLSKRTWKTQPSKMGQKRALYF